MRPFMISALTLAAMLGYSSAGAAVYGSCKFDSITLRFEGSVAQTLGCLLRKVREQGDGADPQPIPAWLLDHAAKPVSVKDAQLKAYLARHQISLGDLANRLSLGDTPNVRYFVIHDTSSPEIPSAGDAFPPNINDQSYSGNSLSVSPGTERRVNLIITRDGRSRSLREWGAPRPSPATKIEEEGRVPLARAAFVHVENIQPRLKPPSSWPWKAPVPGFSPAQEERLALAYIVASVRAGRWLIPAYHFNIDEGLPNGHDDPQHADLESWVARVSALEAQVRNAVAAD